MMSSQQSSGRHDYDAALQELLGAGQIVELSSSSEFKGSRTSCSDSPPSLSGGSAAVIGSDKPVSLLCNPLAWKLALVATLLGVGFTTYQILANPRFANLALSHLPAISTPSADERDQLQDAVDMARAYLATETVEDRLAHVRHPDVVRQAMQQWQENQSPWRLREEDLTFGPPVHTARDGCDYYLIEARDATSLVPLPVYLEYTEGGFKVDWAATVSYQPMAWGEFVRTKPTEPGAYRVVVERSTMFLGEESPSDHLAYRLSHPDTLAAFYAYVPRYSKVATRLENLLGDGDVTGAILELCYPVKARDSKTLEITRMIQRGWIVNYSDASHETI